MLMQSRPALPLNVDSESHSSPLPTLFITWCISDAADAHFDPKTDLMGFP